MTHTWVKGKEWGGNKGKAEALGAGCEQHSPGHRGRVRGLTHIHTHTHTHTHTMYTYTYTVISYNLYIHMLHMYVCID